MGTMKIRNSVKELGRFTQVVALKTKACPKSTQDSGFSCSVGLARKQCQETVNLLIVLRSAKITDSPLRDIPVCIGILGLDTMAIDRITVRGARQHNLKNINVEIPRDRFTVITGLSGSGKSSLAFDTIYAEGQRRYVESLSAYARQFRDQLEKPDVDSVDGLSPAISIEQKTVSRSPRSTVGTVTEIYDYMRLLFSSIGQPHCHKCGAVITRQSVE